MIETIKNIVKGKWVKRIALVFLIAMALSTLAGVLSVLFRNWM